MLFSQIILYINIYIHKYVNKYKEIHFKELIVGAGKSKIHRTGASLMAQWLRIRLPMQGTWVRALGQEDPTCRGATKPVHHNYWAWALEPASHSYWAHEPQLLKPGRLEPMLCNKRSHRNEKSAHCDEK